MVNNLLGWLHPNGWVVDIGCGDLFLCKALAQKRPDQRYLAVDPELPEADVSGIPESFRDLDEAASRVASGDSVSAILLLDVIEHIEADVAFLQKLCSTGLVRPETRVLITVPAFQGLFCSHDRFLGHYRRYNRQTLTQAVEQGGLVVRETGYFFLSLLCVRALKAAHEHFVPQPDQSHLLDWRSRPIFDQIVAKALILDFRFSRLLARFGVRLPGLSVYAICQRAS